MPGRTGRTPLPSRLKLLRGTARRSRINESEPAPAPGAQAPAWLGKKARAEWDRLAPMLTRLGVLCETDADALAAYCCLFVAFQASARRPGQTSHRIAAELRQYAARFGLTPADRQRVTAAAPAEKSKLSRFVVLPGRRPE